MHDKSSNAVQQERMDYLINRPGSLVSKNHCLKEWTPEPDSLSLNPTFTTLPV